MPLSLNIKNLDKVMAEIKAYPQDIEQIINNEFKVFGLNVANDAKRNAPVDEGFLRESIQTQTSNLEVSIAVGVAWAAFLEFGTKALALSYIASLPQEWQAFAAQFKGAGEGTFADLLKRMVGWVARHGMSKKVAYPIALKIAKRGIKAQPYLIPAFEKNKIELIENLKRQLNAK